MYIRQALIACELTRRGLDHVQDEQLLRPVNIAPGAAHLHVYPLLPKRLRAIPIGDRELGAARLLDLVDVPAALSDDEPCEQNATGGVRTRTAGVGYRGGRLLLS